MENTLSAAVRSMTLLHVLLCHMIMAPCHAQIQLSVSVLLINTYTAKPVCWNGWISDSYCSLKPLCSYLADPTSPIPSHCTVIILFQSVAVHQLS